MKKKISNKNRWHIYDHDVTLEWRYLNFESRKISGFFSYLVTKYPANIGKVYLTCKLYKGGKILGEIKKLPLNSFKIKGSDIEILKDNRISFLSNKEVLIQGKNKEIEWDLVYKNKEKIKLAPTTKKFGSIIHKNISWKIYIPHAKVTGNLKIKGKKYKLNCDGYMDGNWGFWFTHKLEWNWLQVSSHWKKEKKIGLFMGDIPTIGSGNITVLHKNKKIIFQKEKNQYDLKYTGWYKRKKPNIPKESEINAENKEYLLRIKTKSLLTDVLREKSPLLLPDIYVFEQRIDCEIKLYEKTKNGLKLIHDSKEKGFAEYTKAYKKT